MFSLSSLSRSILSLPPRVALPSPTRVFARFRNQLAPKSVKYVKRFKGRIPIPTGGSTKGTTLAYGDWGIRIKGNGARLTAKQLMTVEEVIKKKLKVIKGAKVYLRVFPDIPVCVKGNETRMGKGKGTFEYWATRVPTGRVIFEIGGAPIREELAREVLRQASDKLPTKMEFISRSSPPRLGNLLIHPPEPPKLDTAAMATAFMPSATVSARVADPDAKKYKVDISEDDGYIMTRSRSKTVQYRTPADTPARTRTRTSKEVTEDSANPSKVNKKPTDARAEPSKPNKKASTSGQIKLQATGLADRPQSSTLHPDLSKHKNLLQAYMKEKNPSQVRPSYVNEIVWRLLALGTQQEKELRGYIDALAPDESIFRKLLQFASSHIRREVTWTAMSDARLKHMERMGVEVLPPVLLQHLAHELEEPPLPQKFRLPSPKKDIDWKLYDIYSPENDPRQMTSTSEATARSRIFLLLHKIFKHQRNVPLHFVGEEVQIGHRGSEPGPVEIQHVKKDGSVRNHFVSGTLDYICFTSPPKLIKSLAPKTAADVLRVLRETSAKISQGTFTEVLEQLERGLGRLVVASSEEAAGNLKRPWDLFVAEAKKMEERFTFTSGSVEEEPPVDPDNSIEMVEFMLTGLEVDEDSGDETDTTGNSEARKPKPRCLKKFLPQVTSQCLAIHSAIELDSQKPDVIKFCISSSNEWLFGLLDCKRVGSNNTRYCHSTDTLTVKTQADVRTVVFLLMAFINVPGEEILPHFEGLGAFHCDFAKTTKSKTR
ncbi:54S ribosomal protein L16, mitochondrial [Leucoagaricus sp. SymC.cos]|nr:54S ribosomal protein L16, mitochondrial [Leucoagaricus sp. SymC.cos]